MSILMPAADDAILARREEIIAALQKIVPGEGVIFKEAELRPYESDGVTAYRQLPMVAVPPDNTRQVPQVLKYCYHNGIKEVPGGSGPSAAGVRGSQVEEARHGGVGCRGPSRARAVRVLA